MYITEDYSRKVRRHREELLKFAREIKSRQNVKCTLTYDRLYVDNECYLYNEIEQRVQKVLMKIPETGKLILSGVSSSIITFSYCFCSQ